MKEAKKEMGREACMGRVSMELERGSGGMAGQLKGHHRHDSRPCHTQEVLNKYSERGLFKFAKMSPFKNYFPIYCFYRSSQFFQDAAA